MLKTFKLHITNAVKAYHLGEGRVLKTVMRAYPYEGEAYHLGEGRVLKTFTV